METKVFKIDYIQEGDYHLHFTTPRLHKMVDLVTDYVNSGGSYNEFKTKFNKLNFGFEQTRGNGLIRVTLFDRLEGAKFNYKFIA